MSLDVSWARAWVARTQSTVAEHREELIDLDRAIGDGDHGENLDRGFTAARKAVEAADAVTVGDVLKVVARTLMSTVGGAAGPLYGTAYLRAAKRAGAPTLDAAGVAALLGAGLEGIQVRGKAQRGEKTMVDAWGPAFDAAQAAAGRGDGPEAALEAAAAAGRRGAEATIPLKATKGRASYLGERSIGHQDPGATSSALIFEAAVEAARA